MANDYTIKVLSISCYDQPQTSQKVSPTLNR